MNIAHIYPEALPATNARSLSVINTFLELRNIADVSLYIESSNSEKISSFYNFEDTSNIIHISKTFLGMRSNKIFNFNLIQKLKEDNIDIVYVRHLKVAQYFIKHRFNVIFECHEVFHENYLLSNSKDAKYEKLVALEHYVYAHAKGLVFINQTLQNYCNNIFSLIPLQKVVHNGTNFSSHKVKNFANIASLYYVGSFMPWKGVDTLIHAISHCPGISLHLIGAGKEQVNLESLVKKLNLSDRIKFLGFQRSGEIEHLLSDESHITIIPNNISPYSNFSAPIKLYEYMATNNIVIASDTPVIKEIITHEVNGFLFEAGNVDSLVNTILQVVNTDSEILFHIAERAQQDAKQFTWEHRAKSISTFLHKCAL